MNSKTLFRKLLVPAFAVIIGGSFTIFGSVSAGDNSDGAREELGKELTTLFRSARGVISKNQKHINDPDVGDKQLSGDAVITQAKENYRKATGHDFEISDGIKGETQQAMLKAIGDVMGDAQPLINEQGKGFKGFLPAIFARQVATRFNEIMAGKVAIKLTAPKEYVRNRQNRPDTWESGVIKGKFQSAGYAHGKPYSEVTTHKGKQAYRYILPEYYKESCLGCHGEPKGDRDITGGKKEGGKLGELGGAISLVIYNP